MIFFELFDLYYSRDQMAKQVYDKGLIGSICLFLKAYYEGGRTYSDSIDYANCYGFKYFSLSLFVENMGSVGYFCDNGHRYQVVPYCFRILSPSEELLVGCIFKSFNYFDYSDEEANSYRIWISDDNLACMSDIEFNPAHLDSYDLFDGYFDHMVSYVNKSEKVYSDVVLSLAFVDNYYDILVTTDFLCFDEWWLKTSLIPVFVEFDVFFFKIRKCKKQVF